MTAICGVLVACGWTPCILVPSFCAFLMIESGHDLGLSKVRYRVLMVDERGEIGLRLYEQAQVLFTAALRRWYPRILIPQRLESRRSVIGPKPTPTYGCIDRSAARYPHHERINVEPTPSESCRNSLIPINY
jgi:hypothetical protein